METTTRFTAQDVRDAYYARNLNHYAGSQETSIVSAIDELDIDVEYSDAPPALQQQVRAACLARHARGQELLQQARLVESRHFPLGADLDGARLAEFEQTIQSEAVEVFAGWVATNEQRCYVGLRIGYLEPHR